MSWRYLAHELPDYLRDCPGLVGEFARALNSSLQFAQPSIALAASFSFFSTIISGRYVSPEGIEPNLYTCCIAPSGSGKTGAQRIIKSSLIKMGLDQHIMSEPVSGAALEKAVMTEPLRLMLWDECGFALDAISKGVLYKADLPGVILSLYSAAGARYIGKDYASQARMQVESPYLNVFACSTSQRFFGAIDENFAHDGFLPRWLLFIPKSDESKTQIPKSFDFGDKLDEIAAERNATPVKKAGNLSFLQFDKQPVKFGNAHEAIRATLKARILEVGFESLERVFYVRAFENYSKVAMLLGYPNKSMSNEVLEFASSLVGFLIDRNLEIFADKLRPKSKRLIEKERFFALVNGEWITKNELTKRCRPLEATPHDRENWTADALESEIWETKFDKIGDSRKDTQFYRRVISSTKIE